MTFGLLNLARAVVTGQHDGLERQQNNIDMCLTISVCLAFSVCALRLGWLVLRKLIDVAPARWL